VSYFVVDGMHAACCSVQYVRRALSNGEKLELIIVVKNQVLGSVCYLYFICTPSCEFSVFFAMGIMYLLPFSEWQECFVGLC